MDYFRAIYYDASRIKKAVVNLSEKEFIEKYAQRTISRPPQKKKNLKKDILMVRVTFPFVMLTRNPGRLRKDLPIYLYCEKGKVSKRAALVLYGKGYEQIYQLDGGLVNWNGPLKKTVKK